MCVYIQYIQYIYKLEIFILLCISNLRVYRKVIYIAYKLLNIFCQNIFLTRNILFNRDTICFIILLIFFINKWQINDCKLSMSYQLVKESKYASK